MTRSRRALPVLTSLRAAVRTIFEVKIENKRFEVDSCDVESWSWKKWPSEIFVRAQKWCDRTRYVCLMISELSGTKFLNRLFRTYLASIYQVIVWSKYNSRRPQLILNSIINAYFITSKFKLFHCWTIWNRFHVSAFSIYPSCHSKLSNSLLLRRTYYDIIMLWGIVDNLICYRQFWWKIFL